MKQLLSKQRSDREFGIGDLVYVKLQQYRQSLVAHKVNQKLASIFYGSCKILDRIGAVAYRLELPPDSAIYPAFHASRLRRNVKD